MLPIASGYIGPVGSSIRKDKEAIKSQFPCCDKKLFIYDEKLKLNVGDAHSNITKAQLKTASTIPGSYNSTTTRTLKHFFTTIHLFSEINKDMELDCNRKHTTR